jgi:thiol-disulfide isomerase/thioredoxin
MRIHAPGRALRAAAAIGAFMTLISAGAAKATNGPMPDFSGAIAWLNGPPVSRSSLRGKVVLVDFWTYTCINSLRNLPYITAWAEKYKDAGLVVIGVHTPEFSFEGEPVNVTRAVHALRIDYPVAIDTNYSIWMSFDNAYWPADFILDGSGRIRYQHAGEGDYPATERAIQELLRENGATDVPTTIVGPTGTGIEAPPDFADEQSNETYVGYDRATNFASLPRVVRDARASYDLYDLPERLALNHWGLRGSWIVGHESAELAAAPGQVAFRFRSRDLHLILAPGSSGRPVRFRVTVDGAAPGDDHGVDVAPDGSGEVHAPRLYQLVRQRGAIAEHTFAIEFLDPGVHAVDFTFG